MVQIIIIIIIIRPWRGRRSGREAARAGLGIHVHLRLLVKCLHGDVGASLLRDAVRRGGREQREEKEERLGHGSVYRLVSTTLPLALAKNLVEASS